MKFELPENVLFIINRLEKHNHSAYIVGGCVRDLFLNNSPNDYDITTSAKPEEILEIFSDFNVIKTGLKHGTVTVVIDSFQYEITTYRIDGEYTDNRHPEEVNFTDDIIDDLSRRDFTINAIAYNPNTGLVDPFNGYEDIKSKTIKCVGNPDKRFTEDALRILRLIRFSSVLDFTISKRTKESAFKNKNLIKNISVERIAQEFNKILLGKNVKQVLLEFSEIITTFIPEIETMFNFNQCNPYHHLDLWNHTVETLNFNFTSENIDDVLKLKLALFFHDIGKPECVISDEYGISHFYNHPKISSKIAKDILLRLRYSNDIINDVCKLIEYHDTQLNDSDKSVKRLMNHISYPLILTLFQLKERDISAQTYLYYQDRHNLIQKSIFRVNNIIENNICFSLKDLDVNGNDLIQIGFRQNKFLGLTLKSLLSDVINDIVPNEKEYLIKQAKIYKDLYMKY